MRTRATHTGRGIAFGVLLGIVSVLIWGTTAWASTRVGNAEIQMWYRMRHTFHTDGGRHLDWVQWRNEVFGWLIYDDLVKNGKVLDKFEIPLVKNATFNARYRFRVDPVYALREHYENLYDNDEKESFIFPENGFRDLTLDLDFGQVGPGGLAVRVGNQQIVWGESDLFRSIDIINPLRIDQNQGAGEKFDEFRTPIWALKALYNIGNVGTLFSNVIIEPFWTPRFRNNVSDLLLEGGFRLPFHAKGCLDDSGKEIPYDRVLCARKRADGSRLFTTYRPGYVGQRRIRHPFSIFSVMANPRDGSPDFSCTTARCSPEIFGDRISVVANLAKGNFRHVLYGAFQRAQAGGVRLQGTSIWGVDWSLVYIYQPTGPTGVFDINRMFTGPGGGVRPDIIYGDFGILPDGKGGVLAPAGTFEEGLRRCLSDGGKSHSAQSKDRGHKAPTFLTGADLRGYDNPARFRKNNPNGALADNGNALPGKHQAARPPLTFCASAKHDFLWSHVPGFTLTYNDFDYTGMVFRVEQSFSTKEIIRSTPTLAGVRFKNGEPLLAREFSDDFEKNTGVWRSMVGFDLIKSMPSFRYIPGIHHSFYDQAWFLTGQWLMENNWNNVANNFCQNVDNAGNGVTAEEVAIDRAKTGLRSYSNPKCRRYRWNHLLTLALVNQGLFGSRLETRNAVVFEPRDKQYLLFSQWWWRNVLGYPNLELSAGVTWYPSSAIGESWTGIQHFADRDQMWLEFTYYLL